MAIAYCILFSLLHKKFVIKCGFFDAFYLWAQNRGDLTHMNLMIAEVMKHGIVAIGEAIQDSGI